MSIGPASATEFVHEGAGVLTETPRFGRQLLRKRLAVVCLAYLALILVVAIVAPLALPAVAHESAGNLLAINQGPSWAHPLGTDSLGRDVLERLLVGTRATMLGVVEALATAMVLGVSVGLVSAYFGGRLDRCVGWFVDLGFSLPGIIIVLAVLGVLPENTLAAMVTLGILFTPGVIRIVRSAVLPVREELYIAAARVSGLSRPYIIFRHVLPRIEGVVIVTASLIAASALLGETGLAFLNLLAPAPAPTWGGMVADGINDLVLQPFLIWPPGVMTALTILAFCLLGDAARDISTENWSATRVHRPRRGTGPATPTHAPDHLSESASDSLLSISELSIAFTANRRSVRAVDRVSFDIRRGEALGLVGESGCGKTVTAMSILGLLPGSGVIESGKIMFGGQDLTTLDESQIRRLRGTEIGLISQEPMVALDPVFRVGWQLRESVQRHHRLSRRAADQRVLELLESVHLPDPEVVARRYPHELSGGMAQRVAIARALAGEPKLLIADEPTTALDVTVQAEILDLLRELQGERGMAILLVTHDWGVIADLCERTIVMYAGQVVERSEVGTLFTSPRHPYTEALLESNPHRAEVAALLPTIPGTVPKPGGWSSGCHFSPRCRYATADCTQAPIALEDVGANHQSRCIHPDRVLVAH